MWWKGVLLALRGDNTCLGAGFGARCSRSLCSLLCRLAQGSWEEKNQAGEKAFQEGHLAAASRLFTEALKEAQKFGPNDERLTPIYNNLGLVSFVQNKQKQRLRLSRDP